MTTTTIRISETTETDTMRDERGVTQRWTLLNAQGKGRPVAVIAGQMERTDLGFDVDGVTLSDGGRYNLKTALDFARSGKLGLSIVEG